MYGLESIFDQNAMHDAMSRVMRKKAESALHEVATKNASRYSTPNPMPGHFFCENEMLNEQSKRIAALWQGDKNVCL